MGFYQWASFEHMKMFSHVVQVLAIRRGENTGALVHSITLARKHTAGLETQLLSYWQPKISKKEFTQRWRYDGSALCRTNTFRFVACCCLAYDDTAVSLRGHPRVVFQSLAQHVLPIPCSTRSSSHIISSICKAVTAQASRSALA